VENCSAKQIIQQVVDKSSDKEQLEALKAVLNPQQLDIKELCVIVAGLDRAVGRQNWEFVQNVLALVIHLQESPWKVKTLLTSLPMDELKVMLKRLPSIEHDKERKGLIIPSPSTLL
jgi:hypothetical protein